MVSVWSKFLAFVTLVSLAKFVLPRLTTDLAEDCEEDTEAWCKVLVEPENWCTGGTKKVTLPTLRFRAVSPGVSVSWEKTEPQNLIRNEGETGNYFEAMFRLVSSGSHKVLLHAPGFPTLELNVVVDVSLWSDVENFQILEPLGTSNPYRWPSVPLRIGCEGNRLCKDPAWVNFRLGIVMDETIVAQLRFDEIDKNAELTLTRLSEGNHQLRLLLIDPNGAQVSYIGAKRDFVVSFKDELLNVRKIHIVSPPFGAQAMLTENVNTVQLVLENSTVPTSEQVSVTVVVIPVENEDSVKDLQYPTLHGSARVTPSKPVINLDMSSIKGKSVLNITVQPLDGQGQTLAGVIQATNLVVTVDRQTTEIEVQPPKKLEQKAPCAGMDCMLLANSKGISIESVGNSVPYKRIDRQRQQDNSAPAKEKAKCRVVDLQGKKRLIVMDSVSLLSELVQSHLEDTQRICVLDEEGFYFSMGDALGDLCDKDTVLVLSRDCSGLATSL